MKPKETSWDEYYKEGEKASGPKETLNIDVANHILLLGIFSCLCELNKTCEDIASSLRGSHVDPAAKS